MIPTCTQANALKFKCDYMNVSFLNESTIIVIDLKQKCFQMAYQLANFGFVLPSLAQCLGAHPAFDNKNSSTVAGFGIPCEE